MTKADGNLRTLFRERLRHFHWQSVETGSVGAGVPDANYCCNGIEGWVEFKHARGNVIGLRASQIAWLVRRAAHGGRCFVAVRTRRNELWLAHGRNAVALARGGLNETPANVWCGSWSGGPGNWDWKLVAEILLE